MSFVNTLEGNRPPLVGFEPGPEGTYFKLITLTDLTVQTCWADDVASDGTLCLSIHFNRDSRRLRFQAPRTSKLKTWLFRPEPSQFRWTAQAATLFSRCGLKVERLTLYDLQSGEGREAGAYFVDLNKPR